MGVLVCDVLNVVDNIRWIIIIWILLLFNGICSASNRMEMRLFLFLFNIRTNGHRRDTEFVYDPASVSLRARVENDLGVAIATARGIEYLGQARD